MFPWSYHRSTVGGRGPLDRLDLDHVGPRRGQVVGAERPGEERGQVEHPDALERWDAWAGARRGHAWPRGRPERGPWVHVLVEQPPSRDLLDRGQRLPVADRDHRDAVQ